jgi:hypothetical protein
MQLSEHWWTTSLLTYDPLARADSKFNTFDRLAQPPPTFRGVRERGTKPREVVAFHG